MGIEIDMLNVGDGDAIFVTLKKGIKKLLVVIDGGEIGYEQIVCDKLEAKCTALKIKGPDLVVCTHYDSDHIAGLLGIVERFGRDIGRFWVHRPKAILAESGPLLELLESRDVLSFGATLLKKVPFANGDTNGEQKEMLLESVGQLRTLIGLIDELQIPNEEPFAVECFLKEWPEINVIGPDRDFYNRIFGNLTINQIFADQTQLTLFESRRTNNTLADNPCRSLTATKSTSKTNQASVIISIIINGNKYLFTGDAGVKSLKAVVDYPESIRDVFFLKVPHHGSRNNINLALIEEMKPQIAYNSGDTYENINVMTCLRSKGTLVRSTKEGEDLNLPF